MTRFLLALILCLNAAARAGEGPSAKLQGQVGPFPWEIQILEPAPGHVAESDLQAAGAMLQRNWDLLCTDGPGSEIAGINRLAGDRSGRLSRANYDLVLRVLNHAKQTQGAVDPMVGPLRRIWRNLPESQPEPTQSQLDSVMTLVRDGGMYFVDLGVLLRTPGMEIDLEPLLDGVLADRSLDSLRALGHRRVTVNIGRVWRVAAGDSLRIDPGNGERLADSAMLLLGQAYAAANGGDGRLDPRTGVPPSAVFNARVFAHTAEEARVWADALCLLGWDGLERLKQVPGVEAQVIRESPDGGESRQSRAFPGSVMRETGGQ